MCQCEDCKTETNWRPEPKSCNCEILNVFIESVGKSPTKSIHEILAQLPEPHGQSAGLKMYLNGLSR